MSSESIRVFLYTGGIIERIYILYGDTVIYDDAEVRQCLSGWTAEDILHYKSHEFVELFPCCTVKKFKKRLPFPALNKEFTYNKGEATNAKDKEK